VIAYRAALDALIEQAGRAQPRRVCDVHFGAQVVEVQAAAEEALRAGRRVELAQATPLGNTG
jgi:hypothetical protein